MFWHIVFDLGCGENSNYRLQIKINYHEYIMCVYMCVCVCVCVCACEWHIMWYTQVMALILYMLWHYPICLQ